MSTPYQKNAKTPSGPVSATPAGATWGGFRGLLKQYSGAAAGYSLRKIGSGPVVRLRRASDNAEQDFAAGDLTGSVEGAELLPDPSFDDGAQWNTDVNWSVSGGQATATSGNGAGYVTTKNNITPSDWYLVEVDIDSVSGGIIQIYVPWNGGFQSRGTISTAGVYKVLCQSDGTAFDFGLRAVDATNAVINSVSVKPYTPTAAEIWSITNPGTSTTSHAYATTWYDQSGSGNDATQATAAAQPLLIRAGATNVVNGKAALDFDGVDDNLSVGSNALSSSVHDMFLVSRSEDTSFVLTSQLTGGANYGWTGAAANFSPTISFNYGTPSLYKDGADVPSSTRNDVYSAFSSGSQTVTSTIGADTSSWSDFTIFGYNDGALNCTATAQELIIYSSDQSANRIGIETNINDHYGIY